MRDFFQTAYSAVFSNEGMRNDAPCVMVNSSYFSGANYQGSFLRTLLIAIAEMILNIILTGILILFQRYMLQTIRSPVAPQITLP